MKYYLHYSDSFQDEKITKLYIKFGYEGLGLFYTLLEKLAAQEKPIDNEVLKKQLNIGKKLEKIWNFMQEIELISSKNGKTFNENLLNFSEKYLIKKEKTRKKVTEWRKNQIDKKDVTDYVSVRNPPKDKIIKDKINKDIIEIINYFNEKANKNFTLKSKANNSMINARLKEGFTIEDFKKIIDNKVKKWKGKTWTKENGEICYGDDYLRPETLFCAKHFESYLNEKSTKTSDDITDEYLKKLEDEKNN